MAPAGQPVQPGLTNDSRQILYPRRGLFKDLLTDAAEVTVTQGPVGEHLKVIEDIRPGQIPGFVYSLPEAFFFSELKNDSATVLSWQLPRWFMLGARLLARQKRCQLSKPYLLRWYAHIKEFLALPDVRCLQGRNKATN